MIGKQIWKILQSTFRLFQNYADGVATLYSNTETEVQITHRTMFTDVSL